MCIDVAIVFSQPNRQNRLPFIRVWFDALFGDEQSIQTTCSRANRIGRDFSRPRL